MLLLAHFTYGPEGNQWHSDTSKPVILLFWHRKAASLVQEVRDLKHWVAHSSSRGSNMPIMFMNDLLFSVAPEVGGERAISGDTQSAVPALAVAEQFGADDALYHIREAHMQRGLELEEQALEASTGVHSHLTGNAHSGIY